MAGEQSSTNSQPNDGGRVSKLILRIEAMKGLPLDIQHNTCRMNEVTRVLGEKMLGQFEVCPAVDQNALLMAVTNPADLEEALTATVEAVDTKIQTQLLPLEIQAARMASNTPNVTPNSAWSNLGLDPSSDVTAQAQDVIAQARDRALEASFGVLYEPAEQEGLALPVEIVSAYVHK
jgi:hypothetical protein